MRRRDFVTALAAVPAAAQTTSPVTRNGRLKQCVTRGVFVDLSFTGYVAHEYSPAQGRDPIQSLNQAMEIFDV